MLKPEDTYFETKIVSILKQRVTEEEFDGFVKEKKKKN